MAVIAIGISGMVIMNEEHAATIAHIRLVLIEMDADLDDGDYQGVADNASFLGLLASHAAQQERSNRDLDRRS